MPKGPRKFYFAFEKRGLTRFGGLSPFQSFRRAFAIRRFLQTFVRWPGCDYRGYHSADLFLAQVSSIVVGLDGIENTRWLIHNGLIPPLLGTNDFTQHNTLRTLLLRFGAESLRSLEAAHDKLRAELFPQLGVLYSAVADADTAALMTYGSKDDATSEPNVRSLSLDFSSRWGRAGRNGQEHRRAAVCPHGDRQDTTARVEKSRPAVRRLPRRSRCRREHGGGPHHISRCTAG